MKTACLALTGGYRKHGNFQNLRQFVSRYVDGLPPYVNGIPVIG